MLAISRPSLNAPAVARSSPSARRCRLLNAADLCWSTSESGSQVSAHVIVRTQVEATLPRLYNPSPTSFVQHGICAGWVDWWEPSSPVLRRITLDSSAQ